MASVSHRRSRLQATAASIVSLLLWWFTRSDAALVVVGVAAGLALLAWTASSLYAPIQKGLERFGGWIASAFSWSLLALVYFGVFTPLRALRLGRTRTRLPLRPDRAVVSYLEPLAPAASGRFERQF